MIDDEAVRDQIDLVNCSIIMSNEFIAQDGRFGLDPFWIDSGRNPSGTMSLSTSAPGTRRNLIRVLRALKLNKPVLLEG